MIYTHTLNFSTGSQTSRPCSVSAHRHFLDTMPHFECYAPFWLPCLILSTMFHFGCHASFWVPWLILSVMSHFGCPTLFWTPHSISGRNTLFWTPCLISGTNLLLEDHAPFWMSCPLLGVILHSRYYAIISYTMSLIHFASLFRCRLTFGMAKHYSSTLQLYNILLVLQQHDVSLMVVKLLIQI